MSIAICDTGSASFAVEEEATAEAVATAAARAIAQVTAACYSTGLSTFTVNGMSLATAEASAWASAFATATAESSACGKCEAAATFIADTFSDILLKAVASAEVNLEKLDPGADAIQVANSLVEDIQEATIVAFAVVCFTLSRPTSCPLDLPLAELKCLASLWPPFATACSVHDIDCTHENLRHQQSSGPFDSERVTNPPTQCPVCDVQAIATAKASVVEGCNAEVLGLGEAGDSTNPNTFFCNVQSITEDASFAYDAIIDASAEAAAAGGCYANETSSETVAAEVWTPLPTTGSLHLVAALRPVPAVLHQSRVQSRGRICEPSDNLMNGTSTSCKYYIVQLVE